jgi:hypothetical protein
MSNATYGLHVFQGLAKGLKGADAVQSDDQVFHRSQDAGTKAMQIASADVDRGGASVAGLKAYSEGSIAREPFLFSAA